MACMLAWSGTVSGWVAVVCWTATWSPRQSFRVLSPCCGQCLRHALRVHFSHSLGVLLRSQEKETAFRSLAWKWTMAWKRKDGIKSLCVRGGLKDMTYHGLYLPSIKGIQRFCNPKLSQVWYTHYCAWFTDERTESDRQSEAWWHPANCWGNRDRHSVFKQKLEMTSLGRKQPHHDEARRNSWLVTGPAAQNSPEGWVKPWLHLSL